MEYFTYMHDLLEERGGAALARRVTLGLGSLSGGFRVPTEPPLTVFTDHEIFQRSHRLRRGWRTQGAATLETVASLEAGDYVVHLDHGIGRYRGMERLEIGGETVETLKIEYADDEILRVPHYRLDLIERWSATDGDDAKPPRVHKLGGRRWKKLKERTVDSIQETAAELLELYAETRDRDAFDAALATAVEEHAPALVVLAAYVLHGIGRAIYRLVQALTTPMPEEESASQS